MEELQKHDLWSLRLLGSFGEPINPAASEWYHRVIGKNRCPIIVTCSAHNNRGIRIAFMPAGALDDEARQIRNVWCVSGGCQHRYFSPMPGV